MLEIRDLVTGYGSFEVLHGVGLEVPANDIITLLGHNGAGKTTLLRAICGQLARWSGTVTFGGRRLRYVPQERNVFPHLSVDANLRLGAYPLAGGKNVLAERMDQMFGLFPILAERRRISASLLSGGQRQMLAIAIALMTAPDLLLLDEPSMGLAPVVVARVFDTIQQMREQLGLSVLLVEQNVNEALRLASSAYVMQEGRIVFHAPCAQKQEIIHHLWGLASTVGDVH
ncbi:MAG TPA: ABC transporter ATP-binding protein [Chloroflexota bacterium]|nr:ABC transporter ATP-binding protein [Chloroflexota bacterium]